jgi:hypothetical protein
MRDAAASLGSTIVNAKYLLRAAVFSYVAALTAPGYYVATEHIDSSFHPVYGYSILLFGWAGILAGQFAWYANILFFPIAGAIRSQKFRTGAVCSFAAFALGLQTLALHSYLYDFELGRREIVAGPGMGFYLWELSFLLLIAYSCVGVRTQQQASAG